MDLQPEKCVKIFYDTIVDLVDENKRLSYEFEIGREKLNGFLLEQPWKSSKKLLFMVVVDMFGSPEISFTVVLLLPVLDDQGNYLCVMNN